MSLFGFGKKKEEKQSCCCAGKTKGLSCINSVTVGAINSIKVLGAGCKSCHQQYEYAKKAVAETGLSVEVAYITDMEEIVAYGVTSMPAIVINEKVVAMGKVLKPADVVKLLAKEKLSCQ
ncbi:MAG: thioredoxin family protein [Oscillospiraceae bacterium]|nr:thioredoxin family protein [Oscillospiraceae bacterium]